MTNTTRPKLRVSVRKNDIGHCNTLIIDKIFLNGRELVGCIYADEELGEVLCYKKTLKGKCVLNGIGELDTEILKGKVEIIFREGFDHTNLIFFNKGQ